MNSLSASMNLALLIAMAMAPSPIRAAPPADVTAAALESCLADAAHASTAGQSDCEAAAARAYDRRMNAAYSALLNSLPAKAKQQLQRSQRSWLVFRDAEAAAIGQLFETRQGTMYAPMQASAATTLNRDRALQLERYRRILAIEP